MLLGVLWNTAKASSKARKNSHRKSLHCAGSHLQLKSHLKSGLTKLGDKIFTARVTAPVWLHRTFYFFGYATDLFGYATREVISPAVRHCPHKAGLRCIGGIFLNLPNDEQSAYKEGTTREGEQMSAKWKMWSFFFSNAAQPFVLKKRTAHS